MLNQSEIEETSDNCVMIPFYESKTVPAGTFVTVRIKNVDTKLTWITWKDIKTGITVARKGPTHTMELISYKVTN